MFASLDHFLRARSRLWLGVMATLLLMVIAALDYLTGYEISFSIFYLIPVSLTSWYVGGRAATLLAAASAATWLAADLSAGHPYSHLAIPMWNGCVRFAFFITVARLLTALRSTLSRQVFLAQHDGLTGALNAHAFRQRCDWVADLSRRHGHSMAMGFLDLDGFKQVNDTLGHGAGDRVLKASASAIQERLRKSDVVGRVGGDEFAVLLPETDARGARSFFSGVRAALETVAAREGVSLGVSIGVAIFRPPPASHELAMKLADNLMYEVKRAGKNDILLREYGEESVLSRGPEAGAA